MSWSKIWLITKKDLDFIMKNKRIFFPLMVTPFMLLVFTPFVLIYGLKDGTISGSIIPNTIMNNLPEQIANTTSGFSDIQLYIYLFCNYLMPILFIMLPLLICSSISASSIINEKENKTLETLLYAPISKLDLFLGKILGNFIPSLIVSFAGMGLYYLSLIILTKDMFDNIILEDFWLWIVFLLLPVALLFVIIGNVFTSSKAKNIQEAQQFSIILTFPFILLIVGQFFGSLFITSVMIINLSIIFVIINVLLIIWLVKNSTNDKILQV